MRNSKRVDKKEKFEWIHSWCDFANKKDLPRVLLIGDSITHNYQPFVRELLKGLCYVDYIASSYAITGKLYYNLITNFANDNNYRIIHFSNGLHGIGISKETYKKRVLKVVDNFQCETILCNTTLVNKKGNNIVNKYWHRRVLERNDVMEEIAKQKNYILDDLYTVSCGIPKNMRYIDGTHYKEEGYKVLANQVASLIKKELLRI